jgi:hypothetical protein
MKISKLLCLIVPFVLVSSCRTSQGSDPKFFTEDLYAQCTETVGNPESYQRVDVFHDGQSGQYRAEVIRAGGWWDSKEADLFCFFRDVEPNVLECKLEAMAAFNFVLANGAPTAALFYDDRDNWHNSYKKDLSCVYNVTL